MSFFENDKEEKEPVEEVKDGEEVKTEEEPQKIKLGDEEFSQDELRDLVNLGKIGKEAEEKYNTSLDKVWPEFSRKSNQLKEYEEKFKTIEEEKNNQSLPEDERRTIEEARAAARKLGIVLDDDLNSKAVTQDKFRDFYVKERAAERLLEKADKLESEIDGKDGRPKFDKIEILEYMRDNGYKDLMSAYESKYKSQTDEWRANKIIEAKGKRMVTQEETTGNKSPSEVKIDDSNLAEMMREILR